MVARHSNCLLKKELRTSERYWKEIPGKAQVHLEMQLQRATPGVAKIPGLLAAALLPLGTRLSPISQPQELLG